MYFWDYKEPLGVFRDIRNVDLFPIRSHSIFIIDVIYLAKSFLNFTIRFRSYMEEILFNIQINFLVIKRKTNVIG
jgi:hypothetical protein